MKILVVMIAISFLILPAMAMVVEEPPIQEDTGVKEILPIPIYNPIFNTKTVVYSEETTLVQKMVTTLSELIGLQQDVVEEPQTAVTVEMDGIVIAIIPQNSKFNGVQPHEYCLQFQYGTSLWYECEQELL